MDDIAWLKQLQEDLWPPEPLQSWPLDFGERKVKIKIKLEATRTLTQEEFQRIFACIEKYKLIAEMFSSNMFGGYGMRLYEHEPYPCTGAQFLITLVEDHLPVPTRYDRIADNVEKKPEPLRRGQGCGREDAWAVFSPITHSAHNREWLKRYGLPEPHYQSYYDY
jgi:hypothetical protein